MSNFTGVTFARQKVLPSDDATIRRAILSDGILYGCEISYSGATLTMAAGQLLACGRQFRHPSAENWAVADATSGFARLVLTVDLTRTASKDVFDQIVSTIEYATAQDGFPELNQSDINTTGSQYQIVACVVSLGAGGITGIVESIGTAAPNGTTFDLLWENASPASDFAAQKITVDLSGYTHFLITFTFGAASLIATKANTYYGEYIGLASTDTNSTVIQLYTRKITSDNTGINFDDSKTTMYTITGNKFNALSVNNGSIKPRRIFGLKGV